MKFTDDTELSEMASISEGRIRIQNDMGKLERWNGIQVQIVNRLFLQLMEDKPIQSLVSGDSNEALQLTLSKTCPIGQAPLTRLGI